jgi:bifunctional DNA-binding transcriptional regulator/antitoxin component of YhaV-PrlF toxin-antitoxin module
MSEVIVAQMMKMVRPLRSGQITIPAEFRSKLDIDEHSLLQVVLVGQELRIRAVKVAGTPGSAHWTRELYDLFAPVRKEAGKRSEKEIDADIVKAVAAVRRKRVQSRS